MKNWLKKVFLFLVVLVGAQLALTSFVIEPAARTLVEGAGERVLGVQTHLGSASLAPFSGKFGIAGLDLANPPGFSEASFLQLEHGALDVSLGTVLSDEVHVPRLVLSGMTLDLERTASGTNYETLLDRLERFRPSPGAEPNEKRFVIDELVIRELRLDASVRLLGSETVGRRIELPDLTLKNLGTVEAPITIDELFARVLREVVAFAVVEGKAQLPRELLEDLGQRASRLGEGAMEQVGEAIDEAAGKLKEGVKSLGGLLGGGDE